ncbi:hypothetical protein CJF31_00011420 [Rutstroemia sp. NJR-2017a BVV2]|nr:hypothetical protein CJF31_00011420 [Rutstroemia sp. NJR-2017a BVV2]
MALEVIGGIASIAQLAGTVYTLSKTLYEVSESLSNASAEITDLARDLETFAEELNLLSTLLHGKDGRYADRIYRLTAKIIGDCATICLKIDRIIRKSRKGSVWGRVKWLYKEKEILKLLARLRDLKLSLMSTLSVLSALRADYMMDSLGIQHASLLGGPTGQGLSDETMKEVEETKTKLASISLNSNPNIYTYKPATKANPSKPSSHAGGSSLTLTSSSITPTSSSSIAHGTIGDLGTGVPPFMSNVLMPGSIPIQNLRALESVDSFHSATSHLDDDDGGSSALAGEARGAAPASGFQSHSVPLPASRGPPNFMSEYRHNFGGRKTHTAPIASSSSASQADPVLVALMAGGRGPDIARNAGDEALPSDEEDEVSPTQNLPDPDPDPSHPIFLQAQNVAVGDSDGSNDSIAKQQEAVTVWREEMIISAIKNIGMAREDAEAWVMSLPLPTAKEILSQPVQRAAMPNLSLTPSVAPLRKPETYPSVFENYTNTGFWAPRPQFYSINQNAEFPSTSNNQPMSQPNEFNAIDTTTHGNIQSPQAVVRDPPSQSNIVDMSHADFDMIEFQAPCCLSEVERLDSFNFQHFLTRESGSNDRNLGSEELKEELLQERPQAFPRIRPPMSAAYTESSPASNSVGELWLKALRTLELDSDGAAEFLQACLDTNGVCYDDSYSTNPPLKIKTWSADECEQRLTMAYYRLPGAETSVQQIFRILNVMKQTLGFESGIIVWPCLTTAAENILVLNRDFSDHERLDNLTCLAEIATIVARYTVMESIYSNWKGMSLEKEYESALIELSTHVLRYIGLMLKSSLRPEGTRSHMKVYFDKIQRADAKCRGFSAVISTDDMHDGREVEIEDVSDDSDSTLDMADVERDCKRKIEVESEGERKRQKIFAVGL